MRVLLGISPRASLANGLATILPLPSKGEGRGEGSVSGGTFRGSKRETTPLSACLPGTRQSLALAQFTITHVFELLQKYRS